MIYRRLICSFMCALALTVLADTTNNGTFAFLTEELPEGTTNGEYSSRFVTVNADGPVTFTTLSALPDGLALDSLSGFLSGIPTETFNHTITVVADDGTQEIEFDVLLKINAAGGGGNGGASFGSASLPDGRVGSLYTNQLSIAGGVGPFTFGAINLPPGISLNGETGFLSGNPSAAGRYFVTFSAYDEGEGNNSATVLPLLILPADSDFQFLTQSLNNGEVGTPFYDAYLVTNAAGTVAFSASGLPTGLTLDTATGIVSGTPTNAGTFEVAITATDGQVTINSNLGMLITPSSTSQFYWNAFSLPPGLVNTGYDRQPPITVSAVNGVSVAYSATGLPPGIQYNSVSGELSGTPTEIGEFDTTFTATDSSNDEVLTLVMGFVILPENGGDINSVPVNFWLSKQSLKLGEDGSEAWSGTLLFNIDRRTGQGFDPSTNDMSLAIGSRTILVPAGSLQGTLAAASFTSPADATPAESLKLSLDRQTLGWKTSRDSISATVPGVHDVVLKLGSRTYRTAVQFDAKGKATPVSTTRPAFVVTRAALNTGAAEADTAAFSMLLHDASFFYETGDALRIRLLDGETVLLDRDFTALGVGSAKPDKSNALAFTLQSVADTEIVDAIKKFSFSSAKGKLTLALAGLTLGGITNGEAHITVELTIGEHTYTTGVTFFGENPGSYSLAIP